MKSRSKELVDKSILAMVSAIEIYNKPNFSYREETFAILAVNSWELLFKAKWLTLNKNKLSSLYVHEKNGNIKKTRTQNPFTHSLDYLVTNLIQKQEIQEEVKKNLDAVIEMRDSAIHFYHKSNELAMKLQGIGMATLKNYVSLIKKWFDSDLSNFNFFLMPLSFITVPDSIGSIRLNKEEKNFINFVDNLEQSTSSGSEFAVSVIIDIKFLKNKSNDGVGVRITNNPDAPEVRLTEEQVLEKYPWSHDELVNQLKNKFPMFKQDISFNQFKKQIQDNKLLCHERRLDPSKPKSSMKRFYSTNVIKEYEKVNGNKQ